MTAYYVRSGAAGAGTGADWANAYTTLTAAFSGHAAGDIYYVSEDHAESTAGLVTLASQGTLANPTLVYCVDHAGTVPPVAADLRTTATVSTTGSNGMRMSGSTVYRGIIFTVANSTGSGSMQIPSANSVSLKFVNCSLRIGGSNSGNSIDLGFSGSSAACLVELVNTTVSFANIAQKILVSALVKWRDTPSALLGSIPTALFEFVATKGGKIECRGVDLSAAGSGKTIVNNASATATACSAELIDCKTNASVTIAAVPQTHGSIAVDAIRVGSSGVNYNQYRGRYTGSLVEETTIVLTGGASNGTTPISWKIVTTANSTFHLPFDSPTIAIWNDTTGSSVNAAVQGIWGGGAVPNDDDIWLDVEYLGDASSPQGSAVNDAKSTVLTTAAGQAAGSGTWGGSTTKFKLDVSFTPQQVGWVLLTIKAAKASSTFYIDPKVTLT